MQITTLSNKSEITEMYVITSQDFQVKMKYFPFLNFLQLCDMFLRLVSFRKYFVSLKF